MRGDRPGFFVPCRSVALPWYGVAYRLGSALHGPCRPAGVVAGVPRTELEALARESFEQRVRGDLNPARRTPDPRAGLAAGRGCVLATSTLDVIVAPWRRTSGCGT